MPAALGEELEGPFYRLLARPVAYVEEVSGPPSVLGYRVEGGHGEAGAIHQASYRAVELDEGEGVFRGPEFLGALLFHVPEVGEVGVAEEGRIVEGDFRVGGYQLLSPGDSEGIDLDEAAIQFDEGAIEGGRDAEAAMTTRPEALSTKRDR